MRRALGLMVMVLLLVATGCSGGAPTPSAVAAAGAFLSEHGLAVEGEPERFQVKVPSSWEVPLGAYPEGLYWGLANVFSRDAGLDLTLLKGMTAEVWRYNLAGGLPGEGEQSRFAYPSDVVLLVRDQRVVGAWLAFTRWGIGPSVRKRDLQAITGLTLAEWVERERYFSEAGPNGDLARMEPAEVLASFFEAINQGDRRRAHACLTPQSLLQALTTNLPAGRLYHPDFNRENSLVENIVKGRLLSYTMLDPDRPAEEIHEVGARTRVELAATVELVWRAQAFNTPDGLTTRFAMMEKTGSGWKLSGLGTGP